MSNAAAEGLIPTLFVQTDNLPDHNASLLFFISVSVPPLALSNGRASPSLSIYLLTFYRSVLRSPAVLSLPSGSFLCAMSTPGQFPVRHLATGSSPEQCRSYTYSSTCRNNRRFHKSERPGDAFLRIFCRTRHRKTDSDPLQKIAISPCQQIIYRSPPTSPQRSSSTSSLSERDGCRSSIPRIGRCLSTIAKFRRIGIPETLKDKAAHNALLRFSRSMNDSLLVSFVLEIYRGHAVEFTSTDLDGK